MIAAIKYFKTHHLEDIECEVGRPDCVQVVFIIGLNIAWNGLGAFVWHGKWGTLQCLFVSV